ncbi:MAG: hypothetical protein A2Y40_08525 [Candidatus Margulisbacteria bacterium GWF2_35_9]|nr:MAG: hypothetical protein A2Y40_08525 [Candidatus Margulisbacteria bacterium GWF2_35_9]
MKLFKHKMFADSIWMFMAQIVGVGSVLIINIILTRFFSVKDYGIYQFVLSLIAIGNIMTFPGGSQSVIKGAAKGYDKIFIKTLYISMISSSIVAVAFTIVGCFFYFKLNQYLIGILLAIGSFQLISMGLSFFDGFLIGKKKFTLSRQLYILFVLLKLLGVIAAVWLTQSIIVVLLTTVILQLLNSIIGCLLVKGFIDKNVKTNITTENNLLSLGWRMTFLFVFSTVATKVERVFLGVIHPELLALYHIGQMIPRIIKDNAKLFISVPAAHWISLSKKNNIIKIRKYWYVFVGGGSVLFLGILFLSPIVIPIFFSNKYIQSIWIVQWLSISLIFIFLQTMILNIVIYQGEESFYQKTQILGSLIKIVLLAVLMPLFLLKGIISAVVISDMIMFGIILFWFIKQCYLIKDE